MDAASTPTRTGNGDLPFATELFEAADQMRGSVESAKYKHLVLGLLFHKLNALTRQPMTVQASPTFKMVDES
jgi:hypothetical protein